MERFKEYLFNSMYLIGDSGTVKSTNRGRLARYGTSVLKGSIRPDGYKMYFIDKKWHYEHRLVALHFNRNPNKWTEVNHIDGNKLNNHYKNLEWSTRKLNQMHMIHVLGHKQPSGTKHWSYGKPVAEHVKKLMSEAKKGERHPKFKGYYIFNGIKSATLKGMHRPKGIGVGTAKFYCEEGLYGFSFEPVVK